MKMFFVCAIWRNVKRQMTFANKMTLSFLQLQQIRSEYRILKSEMRLVLHNLLQKRPLWSRRCEVCNTNPSQVHDQSCDPGKE
jgi:hypothetical protein